MPRTHTLAEFNTMMADGVAHYLYVYVADADGTMQDCSNLGTLHLDLLDGTTWGESLDVPVSTGTLVIRRDTTDDTAAPTMGASSINRTALGAYAPLFEKGRAILIKTAVVPQGTFPSEVDKKEMLIGRIDAVHWHDNPMTVDISDIGAWVADAQIRERKQYASNSTVPGEGPLLGDVIRAMIADAMPNSGVTLSEPVQNAFQPFADQPQDPGSLLAAARSWAQEIGWDLRYRWSTDDQFLLTLFEPARTKIAPDWTIAPTQYRKVSNLTSSIADIRTEIGVQYKDADGNLQVETAKDDVATAKYGGPGAVSRYWQFPSNAIRTAADAQALAQAVLSDLSDAQADQEIELPFFWPIQIGDVCLFQANGDHYDTDQTLAVVSYTHAFQNGEGTTTIQARGKVAGAYRAWIGRPTTVPGITPDDRVLALKNFREKRRTPTIVTFGWDPVGTEVDAIWAWSKLSPQDADPPSTAGDDRLWRDVKTEKPDLVLDRTTTEFDVAIPAFGFIQTWEFIPVDKDLKTGFSQRVKVLSTPDIPRITNLETLIGATGLFTQITGLNIVDPQALGGTLKAWLNPNATTDANPAVAPDGTLAIAITPYTVGLTDSFTVTGGTAQLFQAVLVHQGAGKRVFFEFVNSHSISSGVIAFVLLSNGGVVNPDGTLKDASINRAQQVASNMTLPSVYDTLPASGRPNELALQTSDMKLYRWDGTKWTAEVPTVDLTGVITGPQIANNIIDISKVAASLAPPQVFVGTLGPSTATGQTALYNGELYRSNGAGGWTKAVQTLDLSGQIQTAQIAAAAIGAAQIGANAVQTANIALNAITNATIAAGAVTQTSILDGSISTPKLIAGAVTTSILAANAVTTATIAAGAITTATLATGAVTTTTLAAGAVTTAQLAAGAVTATNVAANAITAGAIAANAVTVGTVAANAVTAGTIAAGAVNTTELAANAVRAGNIGANEVQTVHMTAGTINGDRLLANSVSATKITASTITATQIAANSLTAGTIAAGAIGATAIAAGSISTSHISTIVLAESAPNAGIIQIGKLRSIDGVRFLDLNASGSNPFISHPSFTLRADGTATFSGALSAASGTFSGTVQSSSFTTSTANFSGTASFYGNISIYASGTPPNALNFYDFSTGLQSRLYTDLTNDLLNVWSRHSIEMHTDTGAISLFPNQLVLLQARTVVNKLSAQGGLAYSFQAQIDGTDYFRVDSPPSTDDIGMWVMHNTGSGLVLKRVGVDVANSGGTGWRRMRVPN